MKSIMKILFFVSLFLSVAMPVNAVITVIDPTAIGKHVAQYKKQLDQYIVQLKTLQKNTQQYFQMMEDYKLAYDQYKAFSENVAGLKDKFLNELEWSKLIQGFKSYYGNSSITADLATLEAYNQEAIEAALRKNNYSFPEHDYNSRGLKRDYNGWLSDEDVGIYNSANNKKRRDRIKILYKEIPKKGSVKNAQHLNKQINFLSGQQEVIINRLDRLYAIQHRREAKEIDERSKAEEADQKIYKMVDRVINRKRVPISFD